MLRSRPRCSHKEDDSGELIHIDLEKLLAFITRADHPPPLGFHHKPEIGFTRDPERTLPTASTCTPILYISIHLKDYGKFKRAFDTALISGHSFENA